MKLIFYPTGIETAGFEMQLLDLTRKVLWKLKYIRHAAEIENLERVSKLYKRRMKLSSILQ